MNSIFNKNENANIKVLFAIIFMALLAIFSFCLIYRYDLRKIKKVDYASYTEEVPDDFVWQIAVNSADEITEINGCAAIKGERFLSVNQSFALFNTSDGKLYRLPTVMVTDYDMPTIDDGINYSFGGMYGFALHKQLDSSDYEDKKYEICIIYQSNGHNFIYHSNQFIGG